MDMNVIRLQTEDDIVSVCDRLDWSHARQILLVLLDGEHGNTFSDPLNLVRLRRYADRRRLEIGLVVADKALARNAKALGIAAFSSLEEGLKGRRGWWRARRRREQVGLPHTGLSPKASITPAASEIDDVMHPEPISPRHWVLRYATILLFFCTISFLTIAFAYAFPRATLTLRPEVSPLRSTVQIVADPNLDSVNFQEAIIPAQLLHADLTWQAVTEATGSKSIPVGRARGQVVFLNRTDQAIEVPAGTMLRAADGGQMFQTVASLTTNAVLSSTVEVGAVAVEAGPQSNVGIGAVVQIDGPLSNVLSVTNPAPLAGGEIQEVAVVAEEDVGRLRSQVLQFLQAVATTELEATLTEREFFVRDSLRVLEVRRETYSHQVGEQTDTLGLKMEARLQGTAVDLTNATGLVYEDLAGRVPDDLNLVAGSINFQRDRVLEADKNGRVTFTVSAVGLLAADLNLDETLPAISGQKPELAIAYLNEALPLRDVPVVQVWPRWFNRMPYISSRMQTSILAEG